MGRLVLKSTISPEVAERVTARVEVSSSERWKREEASIVIRIPATMVSAPGTALESTFFRKPPCTRSRLGSRARTKDGIPIVNMLMRVIWMGWKGYCALRNKNKTAKIAEYMVFTKNREAERWILLIDLRPSATT